MHPVKNALPLSNSSLAHEVRAEIIAAPAESRVALAGRQIRELFHAKFDAWTSPPDDNRPNISLHHLPAAALAPDALSLIARREEDAQRVRNNRRKR